MSAEQRLKRRLFEGLEEDNLEMIRNQPRGTIRRKRLARLQRFRRAVAVGGSLLVIATVVVAFGIRSGASSDSGISEATDTPYPPVSIAPPPRGDSGAEANDLSEVMSGRQAHAMELGVIPLEVRTIVVDAGHGGTDSGALLPRYGMLEKDLTWDIARRLRELFEENDFNVVMTRTGDETVPLRVRTEIANQANADLFVSIHINWLPDREARGFETYFAGATVDPFLKELAAAENSDSGFSVADTRRLLDGLYSGVRQQESHRLADWVGQSLFDTLKSRNPDVVDRGVMRAPFVVLVATDMPAVLAEVACISNDREARFLGFPEYRQSIAEALFTGIQGYASEVSATENGGSS